VSVTDRRQVSLALFDTLQAGSDVIETHVSTIAFDGELVHKRKKPVRFAFVDLSTPARRQEICRREVEVNRRFAGDVYLGVEEVVDERGAVVDHAVRMRRMPADRRLASMVLEGRDVSRCVRGVARLIATRHAESVRSDEISSIATPAALHALWAQNLSELSPFMPAPLDPAAVARVGELAHRYLDGRTTLLMERIARGHVVDGHGDLLADDIFCLDDGPRILDALEFDDRLRWGDVLYDVGFLAMDLERLGRPDLARTFLDWYEEYAAETHPATLQHHYIAYRALVRAKISCLRDAADEARSYIVQCLQHLAAGHVHLVVVGGLPGTGKTSLAAVLGGELGWPVLRTDEIRKELAGVPVLEHRPAAYGEGLYAPTGTEATYAELLRRAGTMLRRGSSVILDGSFSRTGWRSAAATLAMGSHSDLTELCCVAPAELAATRITRRAATGGDASDANASIAATMADDFEDWPSAVTIATDGPLDQVVSSLRGRLQRGPWPLGEWGAGGGC
jgi:aminoglycoside phosphotransferase family enzyme/predicted kinase